MCVTRLCGIFEPRIDVSWPVGAAHIVVALAPLAAGLSHMAASAARMIAPSPLAGEGGEVLPSNEMGEGYVSVARYPSPAPRCCKAAAALSRKGRGHNNDRPAML
jgi:hypothetical protein